MATVLERALRDTLRDVKRGNLASGERMLEDVHSGLDVCDMTLAERRGWHKLTAEIERQGGRRRILARTRREVMP